MATAALYTPEVLALATGLSDYAWNPDLPIMGTARSRSCGSSIELGLSTDSSGRIEHVGIKSHACAIGQAAASIFAQEAKGRNALEIRDFA